MAQANFKDLTAMYAAGKFSKGLSNARKYAANGIISAAKVCPKAKILYQNAATLANTAFDAEAELIDDDKVSNEQSDFYAKGQLRIILDLINKANGACTKERKARSGSSGGGGGAKLPVDPVVPESKGIPSWVWIAGGAAVVLVAAVVMKK
jgi:hypothetical protein